jgi:hypothetical protein
MQPDDGNADRGAPTASLKIDVWSCLPADGTNAAAEVKGDFGKSRRQALLSGYIRFADERKGQ